MHIQKNQKIFWVSLFGFSSILYMVVSMNKFKPAVVPIFPPPESEMTQLCSSTNTSTVGSDVPTVYFITPTYPRREQVAELTRLGQTLVLAGNIHWIIAEDSSFCSPMVSDLLKRLQIPFTHLVSPQPAMYKKAKLRYNPRGVSSRRAGLHWLLENVQKGVVYFGDDDNTYDIRLFKQISKTKTISMFPVGFIGTQGVSTPIVKDRKVVGFSDDWFAQRKFPVDMAGFAINVEFLRARNPKADVAMPYKAGYEEDFFLQNLHIKLDDIEPMAEGCTQVLVWHTKTVKDKKANLKLEEEESNLAKLLNFVSFNGMGDIHNSNGKKMKTCYDMHQCKTGKN
jgi:beta-1,3-glucuronyltransferase